LKLHDKIGQMLIMGFEGKSVSANSPILKDIELSNIGGVILFDYSPSKKQFDKNIESPEQLIQLNLDLQNFAQKSYLKYHRPALPLLISVDYEGGRVNRLRSDYGFPETLSAAAVGRMPLSEVDEVTNAMAGTLKKLGFNVGFAPVLDVDVNPDNPIIAKLERSFSHHPKPVAEYAKKYVESFSKQGVQAVYKHFPGHGSSTTDSHLGFVDVTDTWRDMELEPYRLLLKDNNACQMIMTAHIVNRHLDESGLPATLSHKMLTGVLREQLQFEGLIITDDMQMKAISDYYGLEQAVTLAINAGADMFIFGNQLSEYSQDPEEMIDIIQKQVTAGLIPLEKIDAAYSRIMTFKQRMVC
jgi:beta-N-acetylhexosaminidase